jgi:putative oxidoreductase
MERFLGRYSPYIYAILRIVTGFLFLWHGTQKWFNFPAQQAGTAGGMPPKVAISGTIELVCGILILIGLFAGFAAFLSSGLMAFAYFMSHFSMEKFLPLQNYGELAVLYCFLFLYIASRGSGVWSVDSLLGRSNSIDRADE